MPQFAVAVVGHSPFITQDSQSNKVNIIHVSNTAILGVQATFCSIVLWTHDDIYLYGYKWNWNSAELNSNCIWSTKSDINLDGKISIRKTWLIDSEDFPDLSGSILLLLTNSSLYLLSPNLNAANLCGSERSKRQKTNDVKLQHIVDGVKDFAVSCRGDLVVLREDQILLSSLTKNIVDCKFEPISPDNVKFQTVASGHGHFLALSIDGRVFSFAPKDSLANRYGELGIEMDSNSLNQFQPVDALEGLVMSKIMASGFQSGAISYTNDFYCWGKLNAAIPTLVEFEGDNDEEMLDIYHVSFALNSCLVVMGKQLLKIFENRDGTVTSRRIDFNEILSSDTIPSSSLPSIHQLSCNNASNSSVHVVVIKCARLK